MSSDAVLAGLPSGDYGEVLWRPAPEVIAAARVTAYRRWLETERGVALTGDPTGYWPLWDWSVSQTGPFWESIWDYFGVLGDRADGPALTGTMPDVTWFPGATLNYARNALRAAITDPGRTAVIALNETGDEVQLSYGELAAEVHRVRTGLIELGVTTGDRVAAYLPNGPAALIGLLATASLGAVWSSCSPDFGPGGVVDRFAQITPKVLLAVDRYRYNGKEFDRSGALARISAALPGLAAVVMVGGGGGGVAVPAVAFESLGGGVAAAHEYAEVPFGHPLWVVYSSGTTGPPKPITHSHGGITLEHLKSLCLHHDIGPADTFFWYTTTGWMMWNYLAGALLAGASVLAYDGAATYPDTGALWRVAERARVTYFGTGAPYLMACQKAGVTPRADADLSRLRGVGSTGAPLPPEGFQWVRDQVRADIPTGSFSGGTDLCTGFLGPSPLLPVRAGVISGACLGARVEAYDPAGEPVTGRMGELVITRPMPSMPVFFWNDPGRRRYTDSYFAAFPGVWRHGDWLTVLPDGGCLIFGRSDATLNRGGVRMGTSEFYRVVEREPEIADSLVVDTGQLGAEGRLILYLTLRPGETLTDDLLDRLRGTLRTELSPRHVPDEIHQVPGIPRTLSGKKLEVPVRKILLGVPATEAADPDALANPEVLAWFARADPA